MSGRPLKRDYAREEIERTFKLDALPQGLDLGEFTRLKDLFIEGSSLRLRRVESTTGEHIITKLGQKRPFPNAPHDPRCRMMTTLYLTEEEARPFYKLGGRESCKRRYTLEHAGQTWAIDFWESPDHRAGLIIAETECLSVAELESITIPKWASTEVTNAPEYSAFALAGKR